MRLVLLFVFFSGYSQIGVLPDFPYNRKLESVGEKYKELKIRDTTAVIVSAEAKSIDHGADFSRSIVYFNDGTVYKYVVMHKKNDRIKKTKIKPGDSQKYWDFLRSLTTRGALDVDSETVSEEEKAETSFVVLGGSREYFHILRSRNIFLISAENSDIHIQHKTPGWQKRLKLRELIKRYKEVFGRM